MAKEQIQAYLTRVEQGFQKLCVKDRYKKDALENIGLWLEDDEQFRDYQGQILHWIKEGRFDVLLDAFYQVLPFGTGGRRGPVGIGPNRINPWTIQASAQGHSNYLLEKFQDKARKDGIVLCYDVRKYPDSGLYTKDAPNPISSITSRDFALCAAQVYAANGIKCYMFDSPRSTPELSFAIRHLKAISGVVISASHNPKEDNGKKIYSADGGQLLPPEDQKLADVVNSVQEIRTISIEEAKARGLLEDCTGEVARAYIKNLSSLSLMGDVDRSRLHVVYSPLHGVGTTSVYCILKERGFQCVLDDLTSDPDGFFPNVKFNIPNPEVVESMETLIAKGKKVGADLLINSDPDADRLGLMVSVSGEREQAQYRYFNGNEIGIILAHFVLDTMKEQGRLPSNGIVVKTSVTSELIAKIAAHYNVECIADLLVGFKYIGNIIKQLEEKGEEKRFILGLEESHGFLVGTYCRDKDAAGAALLLCELAAHLKSQGKTIGDYLNDIYKKFGYYTQKQTSLIFLGAEGREKIENITTSLRTDPPKQIGQYKVKEFVDRWKGEPFKSETDRSSRNVLIFAIEPPEDIASVVITARPSGTEPKIKIYIEAGGREGALTRQQDRLHRLSGEIIENFTRIAYAAVNIEMPDRGFRLSNLLPVEVKLKYFDVEKKLLALAEKVERGEISQQETRRAVAQELSIFGKDPIEKISPAFQEKTGLPLRNFLEQKLKIETERPL